VKEVTYLCLHILRLLLDVLDLLLNALAALSQQTCLVSEQVWLYSHLLVDEFQAPIYRHDGLCLVLLQQHWANLLVDVRIVVENVELLWLLMLLSSLNFSPLVHTFLTVEFSCCCDSSFWRASTAVESSVPH